VAVSKLVNAAAQRRLDRYTEKFQPAYVREYLEDNKLGMGDRYLLAVTRQADLYARAQVVLIAEEVSSVGWFGYFNFCEEVDKAFRRYGMGGLFEATAQDLRQKYLDRGLNAVVLDHLLLDLFGVAGP